MDLKGLLKKVVGDDIFEQMKNTPQSAKWHQEGDVLEHTLLVMQSAAKLGDRAFLLAAIMHDLGKIDTTKVHEDGKITAHGHEKISLFYFDTLALNITLAGFTEEDIERAKAMSQDHMRAHMYTSGQLSNPKKKTEFESRSSFNDIMAFAKCDAEGSIAS